MLIVVGYDGSDGSRRALERAADLAGAGDRVIVVGVAEMHARPILAEGAHLDPSEIHQRREQLEEARAFLAGRGIDSETIVGQGDPGDVIVHVADERGAGLIVVGSRGHNPLERLLLGSVSTKVVHRAHCDVLVVR